PRPLDHNLRNRSELQLLLHIIPNLQVAVQKRRKFLRRSVPARPPVTIHAQAKPRWINFLSHKNYFFDFVLAFGFAVFSSGVVAALSLVSSLIVFLAAFFSCSRFAFRVSRVSIGISLDRTMRM